MRVAPLLCIRADGCLEADPDALQVAEVMRLFEKIEDALPLLEDASIHRHPQWKLPVCALRAGASTQPASHFSEKFVPDQILLNPRQQLASALLTDAHLQITGVSVPLSKLKTS